LRPPRTLIAIALVAVPAFAAVGHAQAPSTPALPGAAAPAAPPAENPAVKTFATLPISGATDDICQSPDGTIYVTVIDEHKILKVTAEGRIGPFANPAGAMHLMGIACPTNNEIVAIAYDKPFHRPAAAGAAAVLDFSDTASHVLVFDAAGKPTADVKLPANVALNGVSGTGNGVYFAADSNSGSIYRVDIAARRGELWFKDDAYGPTAAVAVGINGIKVRKDWVYFSAPARMGLYRIQVASDGKPQGMPVRIEEGLRVDDFDVAANGDAYFPVGTTLYKAAAAGGDPAKFMDPVPGGAAALVSSDQKWVYWPTRGGAGDQRIVRAAIP
jgi:hypothetical protein